MTKESLNIDQISRSDDLKKIIFELFNRIDELEKRLNKSEQENLKLINKNIDLENKIEHLSNTNLELSTQVKHLNKQVDALTKENTKLNNRIHRKNSRNSSIPPSQDQNRTKKNTSLRKKSGKKPGGQKGHDGHNLKMVDQPTDTIKHTPEICDNCGCQLHNQPIFVTKRQVIEIPPIVPHIIEHQIFKRTCQCGHCTTSSFPKHVKAPISYGPSVTSLISYYNVRHFIPFDRIKKILHELFGLSISTATVCNKIESAADKLLPHYAWIQDQIQISPVVGCDETGCKVNANKAWMWTWQTNLFTYIRYSDNRGQKTIEQTFPNGLPKAIMVHDCYSAQFNIKARGHQICIPHLLRELNYFIEKGDQWSIKFKAQLRKALELLKKIKNNPLKNYRRSINKIYKQVDQLILGTKKGKGKLEAFKDRMRKKRKYLFTFLEDPSVPPDNNGSERAIRNIKVKTKVSGMFKSENGAQQFAVIRSVIDTLVKRRQPVLKAMTKMIS